MNLGNTIRQIRLQKEMNQNELAQSCGITQTYLSKIENNKMEPNLSTLKIICKKLNTPLPVLFFLSIDHNDIAPEKRNAFELLVPSIHSIITEFFGESFSLK